MLTMHALVTTPLDRDSLGWFYPPESAVEPSFENWDLSTDIQLSESHRPAITTSLHYKLATATAIAMPVPARPQQENPANTTQRWRYTPSGQLVDVGAESASWDLADEIGRLKIADVTSPDLDDARLPIRTPPKSKLPSAAVTQVTESSPLDSSSNTSVGSSPQADHPVAHSRGSSADTTLSSTRDSGAANVMLTQPSPLNKPTPQTAEAKERPHSFSGGLSTADLRRLQQAGDSDHDRQQQSQHQQQQPQQQQQWYRENTDQPSYPSLTNHVHRPIPQQQAQYNYSSNANIHQPVDREREDNQLDYPTQQQPQQQQRNYGPMPPHINPGLVMNPMGAGSPPQFAQPRPTNAIPAMNYRQPRNFAPQAPTPSTLGYTGAPHHTSHLSLGNTQQLYEMMMPPGPLAPPPDNHHPAVARVQQQHNVYRQTHHHHSASDPSAMRDVNAQLALLGANMPGTFNAGMFPPPPPPPPQAQAMPPMYAGQYYSAQDLAVQQQVIAARLQAQYTGGYAGESGVASPTSSSGQTGPSANNRKLGLYKTELCRSWEEKGTCRYSTKCQFAHGEEELRKVARHPKYKTEICKTFWVSGSCPYGKRCCFIHTELTGGGTPATASTTDNTPPQTQPDDIRDRSNSDPDTSISLLARISQQRAQPQDAATPVDMIATNGFQFTKPPTGSLRVDTSVTDGPPVKQNKSAYPSFASNGILLPAPDHITAKSPAPVTAGPDLGRHNLARMEIVGYANHQKKNSSASVTGNTNPRHSFSADSGDLSGFGASPPTSGHGTYAHTHGAGVSDSPQPGGGSANANTTNSGAANNNGSSGGARTNGHVRSGSAGNWGAFARPSHLATTSAYPLGAASPAGEIMGGGSPWSSTELAVGSSRLHEKTWAL